MAKRKTLVVSAAITFDYFININLCVSPFDYYLDIIEDLNSDVTKTEVRGWFERDYTYTELVEWVNDTLIFDPTYNEPERHWRTDPSVIKEIGRGQCGEFSILYVSACLAHGYDSRLVLAVNVSNPDILTVLHAWAEVKMCGWIHVDPAGVAWNDRYRYERCETGDWGKEIGSSVKIYSIDDGMCEEVTSSYLS
jgi:transglutaminase-like putative cysteine protease